MRLWLSDYKLVTRTTGRARHGYLLKAQTDHFEAGYADIFPWPEYGDPDFTEIPHILRNHNERPPLLEKSVAHAKIDGAARAEKRSLLAGQRLRNHYLVETLEEETPRNINQAMDRGFQKFKIKVCRDSAREISLLKGLQKENSERWLRLDCNLKGDPDFFSALQPFKEALEFIEDPFPVPNLWNDYSLPWAYDQPGFPLEQVSATWQVLKPARQDRAEAQRENIIFTSNLDHPVGMAHAFYQACQFGPQKTEYGLMSHHVYEDTLFHQHIKTDGPWLGFIEDMGIGFTDLLSQQRWVAL